MAGSGSFRAKERTRAGGEGKWKRRVYQPDARGSQASIPRISVPFPPARSSTISSRNRRRILVLATPAPSPVLNLHPSRFISLSLSHTFCPSRYVVAFRCTSRRAHTRLMSLLLFLCLPALFLATVYFSDNSFSLFFPPTYLYLSVYPRLFPFRYLSIYSFADLSLISPPSRSATLPLCRSSRCPLQLQRRSGSPCANVSKSVYDITTCSPARYCLFPCLHPRLIPPKPRPSTSSFISSHSLAVRYPCQTDSHPQPPTPSQSPRGRRYGISPR